VFGEYFDQNASGGPDVHGRPILSFSEEEFGGPVPNCNDAVGVVKLAALGEETGKAKVCEF